MRLYVSPFAPNALKVQILAAERGLTLETVDISADRAGFRAINPLGQVPALVLDDGRVITESRVIAGHLDDIAGVPRLFGDTPDARLTIAMWERRAEMTLLDPAIEYGHHILPMFAAFMPQFPDFAATLLPRLQAATALFETQLARQPFVAGADLTAADITAGLGFVFAAGYGMVDAAAFPALVRWRDALLARESFATVGMMLQWFAALPRPAAAS